MDPAELAARGWTRETSIRRDAGGKWFQDGDPIEHPGVVAAFNRWIRRASDGRYCLENDIHWVYVEIDGPPLSVRAARLDDAGAELDLSDGRTERLDPNTLREGPDGALYCDAREGTLPARFERHAVVQLADALEEDDDGPFFMLAGVAVRPAKVEDPLGAST